ncbi:unnamed protein product [Amoebophrya sp. A25]|nr:unnamed protein product [Amoebophrya sp. A25]|eukprot:GSA25T00006993001.1
MGTPLRQHHCHCKTLTLWFRSLCSLCSVQKSSARVERCESNSKTFSDHLLCGFVALCAECSQHRTAGTSLVLLARGWASETVRHFDFVLLCRDKRSDCQFFGRGFS